MSTDRISATNSNGNRTILSDLKILLHTQHEEVIKRLDILTAIVCGQEPVFPAAEDAKYIEVPEKIAEKFKESTNGHLQGHEKRFPLHKGMDAFIQNFREVSLRILP